MVSANIVAQNPAGRVSPALFEHAAADALVDDAATAALSPPAPLPSFLAHAMDTRATAVASEPNMTRGDRQACVNVRSISISPLPGLSLFF
jgi:hypothetical protein